MIDWAAETVYWIERAKEYAVEAGATQAELDSMEACKENPRMAAKGPSIMEMALEMSLENLSVEEREVANKKSAVLQFKMLAEEGTLPNKELELCCDRPECPIRESLIAHNRKFNASLN